MLDTKKIKSQNNKIIGNQMVSKVVIMLIVSSILIGAVSIGIYRNDNIESSKEYAGYVTEGVRARVDAWEMTNIIDTGETNAYWNTVKSYLNDVKTNTDVKYLYIAYFQGDDIYYFAEGVKQGDSAGNISAFGDKAHEDDFKPEVISEIKKGNSVTEYGNNKNFGRIIEGAVPIKDAGGKIIGFVGVDIDGSDVLRGTLIFVISILGLIVVVCTVMGFVFRRSVNKFVRQPIVQITEAAGKMAVGDININIETQVQNEIGILRDTFLAMNEAVKHQAEVLGKMAGGDYRHRAEVRSKNDVINISINNLLDSNIKSIHSVLETSRQVARSAGEIEVGAQTVAEGANEQAGSIEQFVTMIDDLTKVARQNTKSVFEVNSATKNASYLLEDAESVIDDLVESFDRISSNTEEISSVMHLIDNIAFQTNILALNAAVEAARAGQHGKGFAVVADEVRQLANKSAEAAKQTENMLTESLSAMKEGNAKAALGNESVQSVGEAAKSVRVSVQKIDDATKKQTDAIEDIKKRIEEFSAVIQKNSTMSEESATSASYLSSLSQQLKNEMENFKYNKEDAGQLTK